MVQLRRLLHIIWLVLWHRLDEIFALMAWHKIPWAIRLLLLLNPARLLPRPRRPLPHRLRLVLESLGPVFVKFGQILSTRRDLLPADIAEELQLLQDRMAPFTTDVSALVKSALEGELDDFFAEFEPAPLASASIAQVHLARLYNGDEVVVKIVRPNIEVVIRRDLKLLHSLASLAERFFEDAKRLHPQQIVNDYETTILNELNLLYEAANTAKLRRNFVGSSMLYVPKVHWSYCRSNLLVLERVRGTPIGRVEELKAAGTDMKVLAERGVEIFFTQVFKHNFFHADMHPGNIFVDISDPSLPSYIAIDCAIIGTLTAVHKNYLAQNLLAFFRKDYRRVATLHLESGWVAPDTDIDEFEAVICEVCEPIFKRPLHEISFGRLVVTLFNTARQFQMEVQPELVLLQKTLLNIEGLGRQLYPELNLWITAQPLLEKWMLTQTGPVALARNLVERAPELLDAMAGWPDLFAHANARLNQLDRERGAQDNRMALMQKTIGQHAIALRRQYWLVAALIGVVTWFAYNALSV